MTTAGVRAASLPAPAAPAWTAGRPPALVAIADYFGTLAAVRNLGRAGIAVAVADWRRLVPARWSRDAARALRCPDPVGSPDRFLAWLLERGAREPGQVLLAPSDDLAWLFARHREELRRDFLLDLPPLEVIETLLDKERLRHACAAVGLAVPAAWRLRSAADLADAGREARYPVLVKPRTQAFLSPHVKGEVARSAAELDDAVRRFQARTRYAATILERDASLALPLVQEFVAGAAEGVYNLSGFVDETGELSVVLASRKLLQKPRVLGIGLCFEEAEPVPELVEGVLALCRRIGYHGLFEIEFVESRGRHLLIDFNPRLYGQLAFDVARGAELPLLAYLAAVGDREALRERVAAARRVAGSRRGLVWVHRIHLELHLRMRRIAGTLSRDELRRWRRWLAEHRGRTVDPVLDPDDRAPGVVETLAALAHNARHLRSSLRAAGED